MRLLSYALGLLLLLTLVGERKTCAQERELPDFIRQLHQPAAAPEKQKSNEPPPQLLMPEENVAFGSHRAFQNEVSPKVGIESNAKALPPLSVSEPEGEVPPPNKWTVEYWVNKARTEKRTFNFILLSGLELICMALFAAWGLSRRKSKKDIGGHKPYPM